MNQSYAERARAGMRDAILDAVERLVLDRGWHRTRMADVADAAGVSRQTVYQQFGNRDDLAQEYVLREVARLLGAVDSALAANRDDPFAAAAAALEAFLTGAADNIMIKGILAGDDDLLPLVTTAGLVVRQVAIDHLVAAIGVHWPALDAGDVLLFAETIVRLAISHATGPAADPQTSVRDVMRVLGPFIREVVARSAA
ncbi:TetR family transcriptional regulator [Paractinoplanes durhamensis]|uniref:Transcriptional regulator, TetR family protein n=1 Tax=Paractinoplanes durhamensis TaxID=113563 RepID=A0ABQ3Z6Y8_9ACTN|nr:TetR family transcriptional regulator [Actinoplanes durhamensis]GIE05593.1 putative transcriptional regulator, TetR family protein [Actinoplanes durhamensis]